MRLSDRQRDLLRFLENSQELRGDMPTRDEIRQYLNASSTNTVFYHLRKLAKAGKIHFDDKNKIHLYAKPLPKDLAWLLTRYKQMGLPLNCIISNWRKL